MYEAAGQSHFTGRTSGPTGTSSNVGQGSVSAGLTVPVLYVERNMDRENAAGAMLGVLCYLLLSGGPIESKVDAISLALAVIIGVTGREIADLVAEGARAGFRIAPQGLRITALEITAAFTDPMPAFGATRSWVRSNFSQEQYTMFDEWKGIFTEVNGAWSDCSFYLLMFSCVKNLGPNPLYFEKSLTSLRSALLSTSPDAGLLVGDGGDSLVTSVPQDVARQYQAALAKHPQFVLRYSVDYAVNRAQQNNSVIASMAQIFINQRCAGAGMSAVRVMLSYVIAADPRALGIPMYQAFSANLFTGIEMILGKDVYEIPRDSEFWLVGLTGHPASGYMSWPGVLSWAGFTRREDRRQLLVESEGRTPQYSGRRQYTGNHGGSRLISGVKIDCQELWSKAF